MIFFHGRTVTEAEVGRHQIARRTIHSVSLKLMGAVSLRLVTPFLTPLFSKRLPLVPTVVVGASHLAPQEDCKTSEDKPSDNSGLVKVRQGSLSSLCCAVKGLVLELQRLLPFDFRKSIPLPPPPPPPPVSLSLCHSHPIPPPHPKNMT